MTIDMTNYAQKASEKLDLQYKDVSGNKEKAMASEVMASLKSFCYQNGQFAKAVLDGGSFADCMKAVAKGVGSSISDIDAYKKAVQFYFPGAKVSMQLSIDLAGDAPSTDKEIKAPAGGRLVLDFSSIL